MATKSIVKGEVTSKKGFYVGDVCYQMTDEDYEADWSNDFNDFEGVHEIHGHTFAIGGTKYGDGEYYDQHGNSYGVDAGNIGILPYELCKDKAISEIDKCGRFIEAKSAEFTAEDGVIEIEFDNGEYISIDTDDCVAEEDEEYDEEYDDEYDDDYDD